VLSRSRSSPTLGLWLARIEMALALTATGVALALHVRLLLNAGPLWRDEINTIAVAMQPTLAGVWRRLESESFPLLTFVLLRAWQSLGPGSDVALRAFGLVVGLSTVAALWWSRRRMGLSPPLLALALVAVNPLVVRWGDSIRGYGLGQLAILLTFTLVFEALRRPRPVVIGLAALAATAAVQTVYQNSILVFAIGVAGAVVWLGRGRPRRAALALGIGAFAALSLLPYLAVMARARQYRLVSVEGVSLGHLLSVFWRALGAEIRLGWPGQVQAAAWVVIGSWALVTVAVRAAAYRPQRPVALYGLLVLLIAVPVHFAFLLFVGFPTMPWYSLSLIVLMGVCLEAMIQRGSPAFRIGRLVVVGLVLLVVSPSAFWYVGRRQTNLDIAASAVAGAERDDFVIVSPWFLAASFNRYYGGVAPWSTIPPLADTSVHRTDLLALQLQAEDPIGPLLARAESTLRGGHRVYWVGEPPPPVDGPPDPLPPLRGPVDGALQGAYCANWTLQVAHVLRSYGGAPESVPLEPHRPPLPYERARVWVTTPEPALYRIDPRLDDTRRHTTRR
jgi:hypothetical protein